MSIGRRCPQHDLPEPCRTCERLIAEREEETGGARCPDEYAGDELRGGPYFHYPPGFYDPDLGRLL